MIELIKQNYYFAVIRGKDEEEAKEIARQSILGGIRNIEITYSTPNANQVIADLVQEFSDDLQVVVGAGTVMSTDLAYQAIEAGAAFLVSPHFDPDIQVIAKEKGIYYFPGCGTVTEVVRADRAGCPIIKLFPGGVLGSGFIKDIHGPIPDVNIMPSGGVSIDNVAQWRQAGACAIGIGSALVKRLDQDGFDSIREIAADFVAAGGI